MAKLNLLSILLLIAISAFTQAPKYEFRAVWIASVDNIDWPSKKGLPVEEQKAEFIRILDMHKTNGMNAVIVQVRPAADAFYPSTLEPWSEFLNGKQGLPPTPFYDPLQFMIGETHKRGMEFHAWINPYRAVFSVGKSSVAPSHISKIRKDWTVTYGRFKWLDPGIPEVRQHTARVVKDIISRYDVDAVHMDDYFYPYKDAGKDFPDARTYARYGNGMDKANWRRSNVDSIIKLLNETIRSTKPRVKFGISPFGIWRNKKQDPQGSNTNGSSNYDDLYANVLFWLQQGWIDYIAPQLYWNIGHRLADYTELLDWWSKNTYGKHLYIGHAYYRAGETGWKDKQEMPNQLRMLRDNKEVKGSIYFSSKTFDKNPFGWNDSLKNNFYAQPALIPSMPWIDAQAPSKPLIDNPKITFDGEHLKLAFKNKNPDIRNYVIYYSTTNNHFSIQDASFIYAIIPASAIEETVINFPSSHKGKNRYLKVTAVDVNNNESEPEELLLFK